MRQIFWYGAEHKIKHPPTVIKRHSEFDTVWMGNLLHPSMQAKYLCTKGFSSTTLLVKKQILFYVIKIDASSSFVNLHLIM